MHDTSFKIGTSDEKFRKQMDDWCKGQEAALEGITIEDILDTSEEDSGLPDMQTFKAVRSMHSETEIEHDRQVLNGEKMV